MNVPDRRLSKRTDDPVEPMFAAVRRLPCFQARVHAGKMLDCRRRWVVEVAIKLRLGENLEHGFGVSRHQWLKDEVAGCQCSHAL